ncbi:MAG TPA: pilus assembly protein PilM, partial [Gammaproteobacteria bacterium]|nr:pilus assembly protein PilM [Gammaproteobacteria bacterium]
GRIEDIDAVSVTLKRALKQSRSKTRYAATAVSANEAITKTLSVPADLNDREIEEYVIAEAEKHIPYSLDEVRLDFDIMDTEDNDANTVKVLLAASRKENVDVRADILNSVGLTAKIVDIESYAIESSYQLLSKRLPQFGNERVVAIVDVGATVTTLNVLVDNQVVFTREHTFGGQLLTKDIEREYGLDNKQAGLAKKQQNDLPSYETKVLQPFINKLATAVVRALQFFSSSSQYAKIEHIILAGGCALLEGVTERVSTETQCTVTVANPFSGMIVKSHIDMQAFSNDSATLLTASGLSLRSDLA